MGREGGERGRGGAGRGGVGREVGEGEGEGRRGGGEGRDDGYTYCNRPLSRKRHCNRE